MYMSGVIKYTTEEKILLKNKIESITNKSVLIKILTIINGNTKKAITINNLSTYIFFESLKDSIYPLLNDIVDEYYDENKTNNTNSSPKDNLDLSVNIEKNQTDKSTKDLIEKPSEDSIKNTTITGDTSIEQIVRRKKTIKAPRKKREKKSKKTVLTLNKSNTAKSWLSPNDDVVLSNKLKENKQTEQINLDSLGINISTLTEKKERRKRVAKKK